MGYICDQIRFEAFIFYALFYRPVQSISDLIDADCCFKLSAFESI